MADIDARLIEACAACLCWAEWPTLIERTDDPWSYWQEVHPEMRKKYMQDAKRIASVMRSDREYAVVPARATDAMRTAGIEAGRGLRSHTGAAHVFDEMVQAARIEMQWRSGKIEDDDV